MTIHSMSPRARYEATYGSAEDMYHDLRAQKVPAAEAWRRVRDQFPALPKPSPQVADLSPAPQTGLRETSTVVHGSPQPPIGLIILLTVIWVAEQLFWAALWTIGFAVRVIIGLLWFALGLLIGFRAFSR
jgi:hypothetical protein